MRATPRLQRAILAEELTDAHQVADWIMQRQDVMPRLNTFIFDADKDSPASARAQYLDLTDTHTYNPVDAAHFAVLTHRQQSSVMMHSMKYMRRTCTYPFNIY